MSSSMDASRGPWTGILIGALIILVLTFIALMAINEVIIPPLVVFAIIFAALAFALNRWSEKRWLFIVAAILAAIALIANLPFIAEDLVHPETFFSFFPNVVGVVAAIVAVVAAVLAFMGRAPNAARFVVGGAAALVVVAFVASLVATFSVEDDTQAEGDVVVVAEDVEYPENITVPAGGGILVDNKDRIRHTFVVEDQDIKKEVPASTKRRVEIDLPAGTYEFHCDVPGHERMEGTLVVS